MAINYLRYNPREYVPQPLEAVAQSVSTISQKHDEAIKQQTAIENALGQIQLNPEEDAWKQSKIQDIRDTINKNVQYGNYATALTSTVQEAGRLASDPALLGRVRANQSYQEFKKNLDTRNDIDETTKNYYRELNPYRYEDKTDKTGKVIGGSDWQPTNRPVSQVDMTQLMGKALQIAAKDAGGGETIYYQDANGNLTTNVALSEDGLPYVSKSGKYEALTKSKLQAAMKSVIENTPGAYDSIKQDYDVAVWKTGTEDVANKDKVAISEVTDNKGMLLTEDQYLSKRLDPFYKSATYYHGYSSQTPLAGMTAGAAKLRRQGGGKSKFPTTDLLTTSAGKKEEQLASASQLMSEKNSVRGAMADVATKFGITVKPTATPDSILAAAKIQSQRTGKSIPKEIFDYKRSYDNSASAYDNLVGKNASDEQKQATDFTTALDNGVDLATLVGHDGKGNKFASKYINQVNTLFGNKGKEIKLLLSLGAINKIIADVDKIAPSGLDEKGKPLNHRALGISVKRDDKNQMYISLDREHATNVYLLSNIASKYTSDFNYAGASAIRVLDDNGNDIHQGNNTINNLKLTFGNTNKTYKEANKTFESIMSNKPTTKYTDVRVTGVEDIAVENARKTGEAFGIKPAETDRLVKNTLTQFYNALANSDGAANEMSLKTGVGHYSPVADGTTRRELLSQINGIRAKYPERFQAGFDSQGNTVLTIIPGVGDSKDLDSDLGSTGLKLKDGFSVIISDLIDSDASRMFKSSPNYKARQALYKASNSGLTKLNVSSINNGDYGMPDADITITNGDKFAITDNRGYKRELSENDAANIMIGQEQLSNISYEVYSMGGIEKLTPQQKNYVTQASAAIILNRYGIDENTPLDKVPADITGIIVNTLRNLGNGYKQ